MPCIVLDVVVGIRSQDPSAMDFFISKVEGLALK